MILECCNTANDLLRLESGQIGLLQNGVMTAKENVSLVTNILYIFNFSIEVKKIVNFNIIFC